MKETVSPVKKTVLWVVLTVVALSMIVFLFRFVEEVILNEKRNDFTFVAGWEDWAGHYDSKRGVFTYSWESGVVERKTDEGCDIKADGATYVETEDKYLLDYGDICVTQRFEVNQVVLTREEIKDLVTAYEEKREQDGTAPTLSLEERKDLNPAENSSIRAYKTGFLMNYYGVVYYFEPDGDSFTVSSFDNIPLIVNFQLVGENQDKLLLIENNDENVSWNWHDEPKTIYLYDIASQKIEKLATTTTTINSFAVNKNGTRFAYLNYEDGEYPTFNIYDLKEKKLVKTSSPIRKMGTHTSLNSFKFIALLDTDEVVATRTDEGLIGSKQTVIILSERGQKKALKALQEFYIETGVSGA